MSQVLIGQYLNNLADLKKLGDHRDAGQGPAVRGRRSAPRVAHAPPKDPTIREKFNTYRFADYKEKVIDLLLRVTTVSVRTVEITRAMEKAARS